MSIPVFMQLQLFIKSNHGDEETTKVNYLTFIGTPVQATNMNDFKRVWNVSFVFCKSALQLIHVLQMFYVVFVFKHKIGNH